MTEFFYLNCIHRGLGTPCSINFAHVAHKKADVVAELFVLRSVAHWVDPRDDSSLEIARQLREFVQAIALDVSRRFIEGLGIG